MIGQQVQSYRILRQLGAGGMGVVYEAEDTRLGRRVALKFLPASLDASPDATARFEREARILSSLNHPNICTIHDIGTLNEGGHDRRFIVMELLEGESLRSRIHGHAAADRSGASTSAARSPTRSTPRTSKGIVHRDIKPANIFITKRGQAKLLDFGVAKPGGGDDRHDEETRALAEQLTVPGTTVGSINYMSPEQARGQDLDGRSDIFSLGLVLYEMATRTAGLRRADVGRRVRRDSQSTAGAAEPAQSRRHAGSRSHHHARARKGPDAAVSDRRRSRRPNCGGCAATPTRGASGRATRIPRRRRRPPPPPRRWRRPLPPRLSPVRRRRQQPRRACPRPR